ncbi:hypothetical protein, partial [Brevibacillus borstelensis]|uniref:hypothetical protein n=1 Tax=Brevibacillus borstelensis TaxID=45462 RepID=UPI001C0F3F19
SSGVCGLVTEKLLQVGVKSFFYAQKTLLLKGLDLCKRLILENDFSGWLFFLVFHFSIRV